ncbi:hypothetical protein L3X38_043074 [Prunus dulcis]|uniref:Uncharacterized protein n=1 Tax=Prunus dulcis TaxID=3755 RepID=A0AAD4YMK3_PRUDU|nr:hypothetical protein L3X38_043074 [Prunus dulcis]
MSYNCLYLSPILEVWGIHNYSASYVYVVDARKPHGRLGNMEEGEAALKEALIEFGKPWEVNEGDGAFYGPKIDITVSDALNRDHQLATLQLDFQLPNRFKLYYSAEGEDGKLEKACYDTQSCF